MPIELWQGLLIPFAGTTLGAACVFFMRNNLGEMVQRALTGFRGGGHGGGLHLEPAAARHGAGGGDGAVGVCPRRCGVLAGRILFLLGLDRLIPHLHRGSAEAEGIKCCLAKDNHA